MHRQRNEMKSTDIGKKAGDIVKRSINSKLHDEVYVLLAQALIWGNFGFNFLIIFLFASQTSLRSTI